MTIHPGPGGSVLFRVVFGVDDGQAARHDLLELIFGAEHAGNLSRADRPRRRYRCPAISASAETRLAVQ